MLAAGTAGGTRFEFNSSHLHTLRRFIDRGLYDGTPIAQTAFGLLGGTGAHPEDVAHMRRTADRLLGEGDVWSGLAAGAARMRIAVMSAAMGWHVRVGPDGSRRDGSRGRAPSRSNSPRA